jgi:hypothetical protein
MKAYYARSGNAERIRKAAKASRDRRIEKVREYDRARGFREYDDGTKRKARRKANHHLSAQPCEVCGAESAHRHHDDYDKPLDVRWLCREHHAELHRTF